MKTIILTADEFRKLLHLVQARKKSCLCAIKEHQGRNRSDASIRGKAAADLRQWETIEDKLVWADP